MSAVVTAPWTGTCYECGVKVQGNASQDGEACPLCAMVGRTSTISSDRPVVRKPTGSPPAAQPVDAYHQAMQQAHAELQEARPWRRPPA